MRINIRFSHLLISLAVVSPFASAAIESHLKLGDGVYKTFEHLKVPGAPDKRSVWAEKRIEVSGDSIVIKVGYYDKSHNAPAIEHTVKGKFKVAKSPVSDKIQILELKLTESTLITNRRTVMQNLFHTTTCSAVGARTDLLKNRCGRFARDKSATAYVSMIQLDSETILMSRGSETRDTMRGSIPLTPLKKNDVK